MSITVNTNNAATKAAFNLSKASDSLRKSLARLSSGNRIVDSNDDPGGMSVAYKLNSRMRRTEAVRSNVQNSISFLQVQDGALQSAGTIVSRMSELRAMAQDVTKNADDAENYSKEFLELQKQLSQIYREKFNGVELFAVSDSEQELPPDRPALYKGSGFDLDGNSRTNFSRRIYTHDGGQAVDGNVSIGVTNFEDVFKLGALDTRYVATFDGKFANLSNAGDLNVTNYSTAGATQASTSSNPASYGSAPSGAAYIRLGSDSGFSRDSNNRLIDYTGGKLMPTDSNVANGEYYQIAIRHNATGTTGGEVSLGTIGQPGGYTVFVFDLPGNIWDYSVIDLVTHGRGNFAYDPGTHNWGENLDIHFDAVTHSNTDIMNAGLTTSYRQFTAPGVSSSSSSGSSGTTQATAADESTTPDQNVEVFTDDGFLSSILFVSMGQFTSVIERIADARAENGAEQNRLLMVDELLSSNMTNLEAAYGRIMDADIALESARFAQQNVLVQASAAMVAQANQITNVALTILGR
jgi:flagellin